MFLRILLSVLALSALAAGGVLVGCQRNGDEARTEQDETRFQRAMSLLREGRYDEALVAFQKVVDERKQAPESQLELGRLYLDHVKDPISAIYHFKQYLALRPNSEQAELVEELIDTAKKQFARELPAEPFGSEFDRLDLLDKVDDLRAENLDLKRQLAAAKNNRAYVTQTQQKATNQQDRRNTPQGFTPPPAQVATANPSNGNSYTVVTGDTLSSISRKVYGDPGRWKDIYEANKTVLRNPNDLKVGMSLQIPR